MSMTASLNAGPDLRPRAGAARPYMLASRDSHPDDTVVHIGQEPIGGERFQVIAGPCAVESRQQLRNTVSALVKLGVRIIRGGAYKPRTSPYDFQGLGDQGLSLLAEAKEEYGVMIATELLSERHAEKVRNWLHRFTLTRT